MNIEKIIRVGQVSSVNAAACTARVVFDDEDSTVSGELPILSRGSKKIKDYWLPDVREQVWCIFLPTDDNRTDGVILGTHFSEIDAPGAADPSKRIVDFGDGTSITYDRETKKIEIESAGTIRLDVAGGDIVVNGISLVHHTHPGCQGGSTGEAQ